MQWSSFDNVTQCVDGVCLQLYQGEGVIRGQQTPQAATTSSLVSNNAFRCFNMIEGIWPGEKPYMKWQSG